MSNRAHLSPLLLLAFVPAAHAQDFTPSVIASIHDEPRDGLGDSFNGVPFEGLLREQSTREDRAIQEFDLASLAGMNLVSATLTGQVNANNSFDNGPRTFDFLLYEGNGVADLSDFEIPANVVGTGSYHPPMDTFFDYSIDVTAELQTLLNGGATFVGLRVDPTSDPNFPNILSDSLSMLSVVTGGGVGTSYCTSTNNSTGGAALISATGGASLAANNLGLQASPVPAGQNGIFYYGPDAVLLPFGDGFRCVAGGSTGIARLPITQANGANVLSTTVDNTMPPTPATQITAGSTWRFQAWFRDPAAGGSGFNLSDGLEVTFVP